MIWAAITIESETEPWPFEANRDGTPEGHLYWAIDALAEGIENWLKENE